MDYVIQPGDTLYSIARRFNTTINAILSANPQITDPNVISAGQTITIPGIITPGPVVNCPTLRIGSSGSAVTALQGLLKTAGFDPGPIDGVFGPMTQSAVIAFQNSKNLVPDGIVGPLTWKALGVDCGAPPPEFNCPTLRIGSRGPAVTALQGLLKNAGFDPGAIDGIFGPRTQAAVISFQRSKNLVPDGVVGVQTWTALGVTCKTS